MDTGNAGCITTGQFFLSIGIISAIEAGMSFAPLPPLLKTGIARCLEIGLMLVLFYTSTAGLTAIGLSTGTRLPGLNKGFIWSAGFGLLAALAGCVLFLADINPFTLFSASLPSTARDLILFYIIGGLIAPVAEEIFFRGIVYGYIRNLLHPKFHRWSIPAALIISTWLFVTAHQSNSGIPLPQLVGGVVFCLSYEVEKSLLTPIVIHSLGNLALFTLAFI